MIAKSNKIGISFVVASYLVAIIVMPLVLPSVPLATEIMIMTIATLSCAVLLVYGPLLSFGQGAFFGVGAYVAGLFAQQFQSSALGDALLAVLVAGLASALLALIVGMISLRRIAAIGSHGAGGVTFLMLTFAVAQIAYFAAYNLSDWTGGENGLLGVPRLSLRLLGLDLANPLVFYGFVAVILLGIITITHRIAISTVGQAFRAIRHNELRAEAIGYSVTRFRIALFTATGAYAGIAGALYALFIGLVPLSAIDLLQSERIVVMTVLGGTGSLLGALLGTTFFILGSDLLSNIWPHWLLLMGLGIVLVVFFARGGLWGIFEQLAQYALRKR